MEADATAGAFLNYRPDTAPGTVNHASGKVILECETGSVTLRQNLDIIRRRHVPNSNPGSKPTTIDAEACADSGTDHKMSHHPVGRKSSGSALSDTTAGLLFHVITNRQEDPYPGSGADKLMVKKSQVQSDM